MATNHFNVNVAIERGIPQAVFLYNICYWLNYHESNNTNFHEDKYWIYNSRESFAKVMPYFSPRQIRTIVDNLVKDGILIKANFNKAAYDQTNWYTLSEKGIELCKEDLRGKVQTNRLKSPIEKTGKSITKDLKVQPIPIINTIINTNVAASEAAKNILVQWENNIHPISGNIEAEKLLALIEECGAGNVEEAIVRAVSANARNLSYVEATAKGLANGIDYKKKKTTVAEIPEEQKARFELMIKNRLPVQDWTDIEKKVINALGYEEFRYRAVGTDEKWLANMCNKYAEVK